MRRSDGGATSFGGPSLLPESSKTAARWRAEAETIGLQGLFLVATSAFGSTDYSAAGCDAQVKFPPHGCVVQTVNSHPTFYNRSFAGIIHDYAEWVNEPRRPGRGKIHRGAPAELFGRWLKAAFARARSTAAEEHRFVFINAWNEWAEGAYLEPDQDFGFANLVALAECVRDQAATEAESA